ncbi:hypothetical protein [Sphingobium terrigena]|uniref:hypothetical protein n=1 Tax=Sphingobium terrigena TaxID=2304063 RepID=UPI001C72374E|nr:hypothetical protein [Sphingobium terrigena]
MAGQVDHVRIARRQVGTDRLDPPLLDQQVRFRAWRVGHRQQMIRTTQQQAARGRRSRRYGHPPCSGRQHGACLPAIDDGRQWQSFPVGQAHGSEKAAAIASI